MMRLLFFLFCVAGMLIPWQVRAAELVPVELEGVGITEHLGESIDLNLEFVNEEGKPVRLANFFDGRHPVLLSLAYYGCPNLCQFMLNGVTDGFKGLEWTAGHEFQYVNVSIDPAEGSALAARKKANHLQAYARANAGGGWHFLVGAAANIQKLADSVGFSYRYDERQKQFAHAAAMFVLTPEGRIARYLYGIEYQPRDLKLALLEAGRGQIGTIMDRLLLFCYHYDPQGRRYALFATRLMRVGGAVTVMALGLVIGCQWCRKKREEHG